MELRQLESLAAVIATGSFAAASRTRHIAQPALWMQVKKLEGELGIPLFERVGRGVRPTAAAHLLAARAKVVLDDVDVLAALADELRHGRAAPARIGCAEYHVSYILARCIAELVRRHPAAPFPVIVPVTSKTAPEALRRGDVDLVVTTRLPDAEGAKLYRVWIAAVHRDLRGGSLDLRKLDGRPIAIMPKDSGVRMMVDAACARSGIAPTIVYEHRHAGALLALAEHGLATAIVVHEALTTRQAARAARLRSGRERFEDDFYLQWRGELSEASRQLRDVILDVARS